MRFATVDLLLFLLGFKERKLWACASGADSPRAAKEERDHDHRARGGGAGGGVGVDHRGLRVLSFDECLHRLTATPVGRLAFRDNDGELLVLPVNHVGYRAAIAFRTTWGSKLAAAVMDQQPLAFQVDHYDATEGMGWSVLVQGTATTVQDVGICAELEDLLGVPWTGPAEEAFWVRIRPDEVTGRELVHDRATGHCC